TAATYPDRIACHYYKQHLTYSVVASEARRVAAMLVKYGVRPGDRVGILMPNMPEYISAINGVWMAGGIAVALSPLSVPSEIDNILAATDCRIVISLDLLAPLVLNGSYKPRHIFFTTLQDRLPGWMRLGYAFARMRRLGFWPPLDGPNQHDFHDELAQCRPLLQPVVPASLSNAAYILPTGGTTGAPKAVTLSHRNLVANAWQCAAWGDGEAIDHHVGLSVLPFFHSYGLVGNLLSGTAVAATQILLHRFIPRVVVQLLEQHQPTTFNAVPAMLASLNEIFRTKPLRTQKLKYVQVGGAPLDPQIAQEFARHTGAQVVEGYGLSECSPCVTAGPLNGTARIGTIGLPLPDTDVKVVDADTGELRMATGEVGELAVRGPQVMLGYWNNPTATAQVIRDGWLFTGDLATMDDDGFVKIVDRKKDLIITSGFNVYPCDVEAILRRFPGVEDVAVVGVPNQACGELVKAVLVLNSSTRFDRRTFDAYCKDNLAAQKRPKIVEVQTGDLPRNFLGKVLRRQLREPASTNPPQATSTNHESPALRRVEALVAALRE
ncbi:MAG: AMP-binding protein, partial [Planctomycetaceae bacterium]|nr:AMP-binding protein [Planctomycetaceae bacterium]